MTNEEAINHIKYGLIESNYPLPKEIGIEALNMAIKALEQEQYYKGLANSYEKTINKLTKAISEQEPKTVLYSGNGYADGEMVYDMAECPNCGYEYEDGDKDWGENFCPHCGQQLKWESEDK